MNLSNIIPAFIIGSLFGAMVAVIGLNVNAHTEIAKDSSITLKTYWDGDK